MWRSFVAVVLAVWMLPGVALAKSTAELKEALSAAMQGPWVDESGTTYTFFGAAGKIKVVSAIDGDGEVFVVRKTKWIGPALTWTYAVPSTGYVVTMMVSAATDNLAYASWYNDHDRAGIEQMTRP